LHLVAVAIWVGGSIFWVAVMFPAFRRFSEVGAVREPPLQFLEVAARRFRTFAWEAAALIVVTGLFNLHVAGTHRNYQFGIEYLVVFAVKILLVGGMIAHQIFFTSIAAKGSQTGEDFERRLRRNLMGNALIGLIVILLGAILTGV
jgi:uncharacterized membrane protein